MNHMRASANAAWHALDATEPATIGKAGMGWSQFFTRLARRGEPLKVEGDKRTPAGTIIRQSPSAGMMVREGRVIKITLSQGGETLIIPDLTAQPFRNAQTTLQNTNDRRWLH